ncbi:MAG: hypothetical protein ACXWKG_08585 [Limisphaerales bacterium]
MVKVFCRSLALAVIGVSTFWCQAADGNDPVVARYHFIGTSQLTATNYDTTRKLLNLPSSVEYRDLVLNRFAEQIGQSIAEKSAVVRPMLNDLIANESTGVFGQPGAEPESFVIAARLPKDRATAWKQNLGKFSNNATSVHLHQEGEWLIIARGAALKRTEDNFTAEIGKNHRPVAALKDTVLEANIDWPRLSNVPEIAALPFKPAVLSVKVSPKGNHLRTEIHAHYPQAIAWKSQQWHLPTETIHDPLVSLTAGQDVAAFMKPSQLAERIGENPFTNQFFLWANVGIPFQTGALFPMKNAQRHVQSLGRELPSRFNAELKKSYNGELKYIEKTNELVWQGVPILAPFLKSIHEKAGDFLCLGTFALIPGPQAPADLWAQFRGRSDLVYYDWEIAGPRLAQWRMLAPLLPIFPVKRVGEESFSGITKTNEVSHTPTAIVDRWISDLIPSLSPSKENSANGNVVTEVTRNSATDYTVVRSSQVGFTGIELLLLTHWLADTHPMEVRRPGTPISMPPGHVRKPAK